MSEDSEDELYEPLVKGRKWIDQFQAEKNHDRDFFLGQKNSFYQFEILFLKHNGVEIIN
jgi:hypothetical protein